MFAFFVPGQGEHLVLLMGVVVFVGSIAAAVLPLWFICKKAGLPAWYSLVGVVPVFTVVLLFYLAWADWPALSSANRNRQ